MSQYRIDYYVKPAEATRITKLGGVWGEKSEQTIMNEISNMTNHYYVSGGGSMAWIEIERTMPGNPYLKTVPDHTRLDNLLHLTRRYT